MMAYNESFKNVKNKNIEEINISELTIYEIYDKCYKDFLNMGSEYVLDNRYLDEIINRDFDTVCSLNLLKNFNLDKNQIRKILISFLDNNKNIDTDTIFYCLSNINMDKDLSKKITQLYIDIYLSHYGDDDDDDDIDGCRLYNLLLTAKYADKDIILKVFLNYSNINDYLLDIAINIENVDLLLIAKHYIDNIDDVSELIKFASLVKLNNTDILDKNFIKHAETSEEYIKYIQQTINKVNVSILTKNFLDIVRINDFEKMFEYTQAIINNQEEDMKSLFLLKNKFVLSLDDYAYSNNVYINFMKLLEPKINIDELYSKYLTGCCSDIEDFEALINNLNVPEKFIENNKSNNTILDRLFYKSNYSDVYNFVSKYNLFSIETIENKLIQSITYRNLDETLVFYLNINGLNVDRLQKCIITNYTSNDNDGYELFLFASKINESNKKLLFDNFLKLDSEFNIFVQFVKLLELDEELLQKIRKYIYIYDFGIIYEKNKLTYDVQKLFEFLIKYPEAIDESIEAKLLSLFYEKELLKLYKHIDTFSDLFLIKIIKFKCVSLNTIWDMYYENKTKKQRNILIALISTKGFTTYIFKAFNESVLLTEDEKFNLLVKFDTYRCYTSNFFKKFKSNRTVEELEDLVIQNDSTGELCFQFAYNYLNSNKNKLLKICIDNNYSYTDNFFKIPNINIPDSYLNTFTLKGLYETLNKAHITNKEQLEKYLIIKDRTGKYLYELLKKSKAINEIEIYNILAKKNNLYGILCRQKFKKIYDNLSFETKTVEESISNLNNGNFELRDEIVEDLMSNDALFLRYEKIKFKLNKLNNKHLNNDSTDLIIRNMVQTLNIKKDLLKDELIINELVNYFDSIITFIDSIIESNKESKDFIECSLNEKVAKEIRSMSEMIASTAEEIKNSNKFIR